jgi:hypothetical protein
LQALGQPLKKGKKRSVTDMLRKKRKQKPKASERQK